MTQRETIVNGNPVRTINATAGNETYQLPGNFAPGRTVTVRREDSSGNAVSITLASGQSLDGTVDATVTIPANTSAVFEPAQVGVWESYGLASGGGGGGGAVSSVAGKTGAVSLAGADITSGTVDIARLPVGTTSTTVTVGNDSRVTGAAQRSGGNTWTGAQDFTGATMTGVGGSATDATTGAKGVVQLAGDLAGTAASPTVPGLAGKAADNAVVHLAGAETVAGVKTFSALPVIPTAAPSLAGQVVSKSAMDAADAAVLTTASATFAAKSGAIATGTWDFTSATVTGISASAGISDDTDGTTLVGA